MKVDRGDTAKGFEYFGERSLGWEDKDKGKLAGSVGDQARNGGGPEVGVDGIKDDDLLLGRRADEGSVS